MVESMERLGVAFKQKAKVHFIPLNHTNRLRHHVTGVPTVVASGFQVAAWTNLCEASVFIDVHFLIWSVIQCAVINGIIG